jgi:hypothetical protein
MTNEHDTNSPGRATAIVIFGASGNLWLGASWYPLSTIWTARATCSDTSVLSQGCSPSILQDRRKEAHGIFFWTG